MNTRTFWHALVACSLSAFVAPALSGEARDAERSSGAQHGMMGGDMAEECKRMMSEREQMMSQMRQSQDELTALVEKMKQSKGDAKVEAIQEVVSTLVLQRKQMMDHMAQMQPRMMAHMMRHMHMNMTQGGEDPTGGCPMMKEMMAKPEDDSQTR